MNIINMKMLSVLALLLMFTLFFSGCTSPKPEMDWNEALDTAWNADSEFDILVGDKIDSMEFIPTKRMTKVTLRSNPSIPVYLYGLDVSKVNDDVSDISHRFVYGEDITFRVQIRHDKFTGDYLMVQLNGERR